MFQFQIRLCARGRVLGVPAGYDGQVFGQFVRVHSQQSDLIQGVPVIDEAVSGDPSVCRHYPIGAAETGRAAYGSSGGDSEGYMVLEDGGRTRRSPGRPSAGPVEVERVLGDFESGIRREGTETELVHIGLPDEFSSGRLHLGYGGGVEYGTVSFEDLRTCARLESYRCQVVLRGEQELRIVGPFPAEVVEHAVDGVDLLESGEGVLVAHTSFGPLM